MQQAGGLAEDRLMTDTREGGRMPERESTKGDASGKECDTSAVAEVERLIDAMISRPEDSIGPLMALDIPQLRRALERARREDVFGLIDVAVGQAVATGVEMLTRAQLALRAACRYGDNRRAPSGQEFPNVNEQAERVQRIAFFLTQIGRDYARIARRSHLAKRRNADPKVVDFREARETVATKKKAAPGRSEAKAGGGGS